jgi:hypothetical protein
MGNFRNGKVANSTFSNANTTISFAVLSYHSQCVFSVRSNSTLSGLTFNSEDRELSFSVTGPSGTSGYVDVFIPKSLSTTFQTLKVTLMENN